MTELEEKADKYVKSLDDYYVKCCGDFEVEDMKMSYQQGYEQGHIDSSVTNASVIHSYSSDLLQARNRVKELELQIKAATDKINLLESTEITLSNQIKKMKCCENCLHHTFWGDELKCNLVYGECSDKNKWEFDNEL